MKNLEEQAIEFISEYKYSSEVKFFPKMVADFARQAVHQALDEAAEKIPIPINPKTIDINPDITTDIMKRLNNEYFAAVDLRGSILKLKEKY